METPDFVHNYDNMMLFIDQLRKKLDLEIKERDKAFFLFKRNEFAEEAKKTAKIFALAMIKLNELLEHVQLTEINDLLKTKP